MHLRQPGSTYSTCGSFTKNKERIHKFKETGDSWYIRQNELDKACLQHDIAYGDFKELTIKKLTVFDKILCAKRLILVKIQNLTKIKWIFPEWFINFLIK